MADFFNWRFNPFTEVSNDVENTEIHTIEYFSEPNLYGIRTNEGIKLDSPSTVSIVENVTGGLTFTEVSRSQNPSSGQFRVDYDAANYYNTGLIEFNSADNWTEVEITYQGTGTLVKDNYTLSQASVIPNSLGVEGDLEVTGNYDLDGILTAGGALNLTGALTALSTLDLTGAFTVDGASQFNENINIATNKEIQYNGSTLFGFISGGVPLYGKILTATISSGASTASVAHGIANAYTNRSILAAFSFLDDSTAMCSTGAGGNRLAYVKYDNTNLTFIRDATPATSNDCKAFVIYRD